MTRDTLMEDLEFVRSMAEAGQEAPLVGGRFLAMWGGLTAAALIGQWAYISGHWTPPVLGPWFVWTVFGVLGGVGMLLLMRAVATAPGASAANNRVAGAVWMSTGAGLCAVFLGLLVGQIALGLPVWIWNVMPAAALMLYGVAHLTTAAFMRSGAGRIAGVLALVFGAGVLALVNSVDAMLVAAIGLIASAFIPGLIQIAREPKTTV